MTQIMMVQPAAPPAQPQANQVATSDSDQFSNHLDKAIESDRQSNSQNDSQSDSNTEKSSQNNQPSDVVNGDGATESAEVAEDGSELNSSTTNPETTFEQTADAVATQIKQPASTNTLSDGNTTEKLPLSFRLANDTQTLNSQTLNSQTLKIHTNPQQLGVQDTIPQEREALLAQIQKIIDASSETGTVSIRQASNSLQSSTQSTTIAQTALATATNSDDSTFQNILGADGNPLKVTGEKSDTQLTSLRQNTEQQYYDAKMSLQNGKDQNTNSEGKQQDNNGTSQSPATSQAGATQTATPTTEFTQVTAPVTQTITTDPLLDTSRAITLPSGITVSEDDIVQQVVERFQVNKRQLETKLNLKLHPAELGELKIDITLKEGSIRANVVAQSQQVQELIEKNLLKLKAVLEEQGFSIEEILVTAESDSVGAFDLFDKNLAGGQEYTPQQIKKNDGYADTEFSIDELIFDPEATSATGVNVKA